MMHHRITPTHVCGKRDPSGQVSWPGRPGHLLQEVQGVSRAACCIGTASFHNPISGAGESA